MDIPSPSQETLHCWLCFHARSLERANLQYPADGNVKHPVFSFSKEKSQLFSATWNKSAISLEGRKHCCTPLAEFHPTSPVHTQAHITHNSWYCTKKSHSATPGSASKGNVNVKGKVLLVCRISIIQLEISIKISCSLVF